MLAEGFLGLALEVDLEGVAVVLAEANGRLNVEVVEEAGDVQED
jgi:hypothetical protein